MPFSVGNRKTAIVTLTSELVITAIGLYLSYGSIGTPVSNANGNVIRSTVTSFIYPILAVSGMYLFGMDLSNRFVKYWKKGLWVMLLSALSVSFVSTPFLIYYNYYYSYTTTIGGTAYTVYPYGVQPGIPFMLGLLIAFIAGLFLLIQWINRKRIKIRKSPFIRISSKNRSVTFSKDDTEDK